MSKKSDRADALFDLSDQWARSAEEGHAITDPSEDIEVAARALWRFEETGKLNGTTWASEEPAQVARCRLAAYQILKAVRRAAERRFLDAKIALKTAEIADVEAMVAANKEAKQ